MNQSQVEVLAGAAIHVPLSTPSQSTVWIGAFESVNETTLQHLVVDPDNMDTILSSSDIVQLLVFGT